jgi:hypothetical protein
MDPQTDTMHDTQARRTQATCTRFGAWAGVSLAATAAAGLAPAAALAVGAVGALAAVALLRDPLGVRLATAVAMAPAVAGDDAPAWLLALAGLLVALAEPRALPEATRGRAGLHEHLAGARRREERAHLLVLGPAQASAKELHGLFRLTDSVALRAVPGGHEVTAVVDDHSFTRDGLERRVRDTLGEVVQMGWAAFPQDGYTVDALEAVARERLLHAAPDTHDERPRPAVGATAAVAAD